jgi:hypothetical protein
MPTESQKLNIEVTMAIHRGEHQLEHAISAWEEVEKAELAIFNSTSKDILDSDKTLASRGVGSARVIITVLKSLRGKDTTRASSPSLAR